MRKSKKIFTEHITGGKEEGGTRFKRIRPSYHSLFSQASDAIYVNDFEGNFIDVNDSFCRMFGYARKEFRHLKINDLIEPAQLKERPIAFARVAAGEHVFSERRMVTKSGEVLDMEINVRKFGKNLIMSIARNVTETKKAQKTVALNEARFRAAFEHAGIGMALVSLKGQWLKVNKALCDMVGYTEEELLAKTFSEITHPDDVVQNLELLDAFVKSDREVFRFEKRYIHKQGTVVWISVNVSVIKDSDGSPLYFVSQIEDITGRKKISAQLTEHANLLQLFIEHSPAALAMFDTDMNYIQVSKRWMTDYNLGNTDLVGKNHYDVFPTVPEEWREIHRRCLAGAIERRDEDSFVREDGSREWLQWEIHPWRRASGEIGGIIMLTEVITEWKESQLKFRNLVEKSLVGVYILQNGKFAYVNPRIVEQSGYSEEELNGMPVEEIVYKEDLERMYKNIQSRLNGEQDAARYELRAKKKDGTLLWLEMFGTSTLYKGAQAIIGTIINITGQKAVYNELIKSEANLKSVFDSTQVAYLLIDGHFNILAYNQYYLKDYEDLTGLVLQAGSNYLDLVMPARREAAQKILRAVLTTAQTEQYETCFNHKEPIRYFDVTVSPVMSDGSVIGLCIAAVDVTNKKNMEMEREKIITDLISRNKNLQEFAHIVSHNLRGPLSTILGLTNLLKDGGSEQDKDMILEGIDVSAEKLDSVVLELNNILNAKYESSEIRESVALNDVLLQVKEKFTNLILLSKAEIVYDFSACNELFTLRSFIENIFNCLISNSLKYRDRNRPPYINVWTERSDGAISLIVRDNGIGIDMQKYGDKIFLLNKRFHNAVEGKGLGLFTVKAQVDVLGGNIAIDSGPDAGTTVKIVLPE